MTGGNEVTKMRKKTMSQPPGSSRQFLETGPSHAKKACEYSRKSTPSTTMNKLASTARKRCRGVSRRKTLTTCSPSRVSDASMRWKKESPREVRISGFESRRLDAVRDHGGRDGEGEEPREGDIASAWAVEL